MKKTTANNFEKETLIKGTGFETSKSGLFFRNFDGAQIRICDEVKVCALVSNFEATGWGKLLQFANAHNQKRNLCAPMKLLMGSSRYLAAELSLRGLQIESDALRMKLLREYLNGERPQKILRLDCNFLCGRAFFIESRSGR